LIGIDDSLLSVIFGESLPEEASEPPPPLPLPTIPEQAVETRAQLPLGETWQDRLLERIARELGILVHQLSSHPGAFTTYLQPTAIPDYAGIPISSPPSTTISPLPTADATAAQHTTSANLSTFSPTFSPTLNDPANVHAASWGIEDSHRHPSSATLPTTSSAAEENDRCRGDREYWERELDIKMVFRFLRNRFGSSSSPSHRPSSSHNNNSIHPTPIDSARRAAIIRQHHPLVARAHATKQHMRRPSSSCASQSLRGGSAKRSAGSSRNYWDINGSVGSGSIVGSAGLGAWGEV